LPADRFGDSFAETARDVGVGHLARCGKYAKTGRMRVVYSFRANVAVRASRSERLTGKGPEHSG